MTAAAPTVGAAPVTMPVSAAHHCRRDFIFRGARVLRGEPFSAAALDVPADQVTRMINAQLLAIGPASERMQFQAMERREQLDKANAAKPAKQPKVRPARKAKATPALEDVEPQDLEVAEVDPEDRPGPAADRSRRNRRRR